MRDNPNTYAQDLIITSPSCRYKFLELQVVNQWQKQEFPYDSLYVYARKAVYSDNTLFLTVNKFLTRGYIFDISSFRDSEPVRLKKYSREFVYLIPWSRALLVELDNLDSETIEMY